MRPANRPLCRVGPNQRGMSRAAASIHWYLLYEGPQTVFMDDAGRVFAMPQGMSDALRWLDAHRDWWVGNYVLQHQRWNDPAGGIRTTILADLRVRWTELREACVA